MLVFTFIIIHPNITFSPPDTPTELSGVGDDKSIFLTFTQPPSVVPVINYSYSIDNGNTFTLFNPKQKVSPLRITGLTNGQTYNVSINAYKGYYSKQTAAISVFVNAPQPPAVINAVQSKGENGIATIYFSQSINNLYYAITNYLYSIDGGVTFTPLSLPKTTSPIEISGLTNGEIYSVAIKSDNGLISDASNIVDVFVNGPQPKATFDTIQTKGGNQVATVYFNQNVNNSYYSITNYLLSINCGQSFNQ